MVASILRQVLLFVVFGAPFVLLEARFPAHRVRYRKVLARDVGALFLVVLSNIPMAPVNDALLLHLPLALFRGPDLPLWASVPLGIVVSDFAMYWTHRLIHARPFWRVHRWHHAPRQMYWLAGGRRSFLQGIVYAFPPLAFLVFHVPMVFIDAYAFYTIALNHWTHSNLGLKLPWLETVLVTPRVHHIHHSRDPAHYNRNFGSIFSVWDRMFGTYLDPDDVSTKLKFGIPEAVRGPRLVVGV